MIASNLKVLRKHQSKSQEDVANDLGIKRTTLSGYENGSAEPSIALLLKFASYYSVSLESLLVSDLESLSDNARDAIIQAGEPDVSGRNLRIIATSVDSENNENIELVPLKARAGYTAGYADPDFIKVLPAFQLPFLSREKKYRTFPIVGDSMPPVPDGSWVTGEYLQNWNFIRNGHPYIVVTKDEGIVFKLVYNNIKDQGTLLLCSTNPLYEPYEIQIKEVLEVWKFTHYISSELPEPNLNRNELSASVRNLQNEVRVLKNTLRVK